MTQKKEVRRAALETLRSLPKREVVYQDWIESERRWGQRPDGASLHITVGDCARFVQEYWDTMPDEAPDEYSRPSGMARIALVSPALYERVRESGTGLRIYDRNDIEVTDRLA